MRLVAGLCVESGVKQGYVLTPGMDDIDGFCPKKHDKGSTRTKYQINFPRLKLCRRVEFIDKTSSDMTEFLEVF